MNTRTSLNDLVRVSGLTVKVAGELAVRGVDLAITAGQRVGLVGESGAGKSLTARSITGVPPAGAVLGGRVVVGDRDIVGMDETELAEVRRDWFGFVPQDAGSALNPLMRVGRQIEESLGMNRAGSTHSVSALLEELGFPDPASAMRAYPHQLSGGQRQRVLIAIALASSPKVLVADEPTTALDVTVQLEVLNALVRAVDERRLALLFVTHDLPVVAALCDHVLVMYAGKIVESGPVERVIGDPCHPYTMALINAIPRMATLNGEVHSLEPIPGAAPQLGHIPEGCAYRDRCPRASSLCASEPPLEVYARAGDESRRVACWHPLQGST